MSVTEKRTELYVGLFVFFGLAIMAVLILQFGRFEDRFKEKYPLHVSFTDATGIFSGVDVLLGGVKVGVVVGKPRPNSKFDGVIVDLEIFNHVEIPRNTEFSIMTRGLMGDSYIGAKIPKTPEGGILKAGDDVTGVRGSDLQDLTNTAGDLSEQAKVLLSKLTDTVLEIRVGVDNLNSALDKFDNDILGDENLENVKVALANLRGTSETFSEASTKLAPLLEEAHGAVANAGETFEGTQDLIAKLAPVIEDFEATAEGAAATIEKANRGDGLLSAILNDAELKADFTALIANLRDHGVLRYKDDSATAAEEPSSRSTVSPKRHSFFNKR